MIDIVYMAEEPPIEFFASVFLAGSSCSSRKSSWRAFIIEALREVGYSGVIFYPECHCSANDEEIYEWKSMCMRMSDIIIFHFDREDLDTNRFDLGLEFGEWARSGKVILSWVSEYDKIPNLIAHADYFGVRRVKPLRSRMDTLTTLAEVVANQTRNGAYRSYGERFVPLHIWHHPSFQSWYDSHRRAGNYLTDANLEYIFRVSPNRPIFLFVLHAYLWIESEERVKSNEFVLSRTDISTVVLLYGDIYSQDLADIEVVLIKEFRTPVNNSDCFVYENPGGSTQPSLFFRDTAIEEVQEETGLRLSPSRLIPLGSRQLVSTLSSHKSHTFVYYLNQDEYLKLLTDSRVHGVESDTERTYIEVTNLAKVLENDLVDWSQLGMIFQAIQVLRKQGNH